MTTSMSSAAGRGLPGRRQAIEAWIERLIALLDEMDGDPDMEQTAREAEGTGFGPDAHPDDSEIDDNGLADDGGCQEQSLRDRGVFWFVEDAIS